VVIRLPGLVRLGFPRRLGLFFMRPSRVRRRRILDTPSLDYHPEMPVRRVPVDVVLGVGVPLAVVVVVAASRPVDVALNDEPPVPVPVVPATVVVNVADIRFDPDTSMVAAGHSNGQDACQQNSDHVSILE